MGPSNEQQLEIAREVDRIALEGKLDPSKIGEIVAALTFTPLRKENEFLVAYLRWRMDHPIAK